MVDTAVPALALDDEGELGKSYEAPSPLSSDFLDTASGPVLSVDAVDVPRDYGPLSPLTSLDSDSEHEQDVEDDDDVSLAKQEGALENLSVEGWPAVRCAKHGEAGGQSRTQLSQGGDAS